MPIGAAKAVYQGYSAGGGSFTAMTASGGTTEDITHSGTNYRIHKFASSGTFSISDLGDSTTVDVLIVGGGGAGGNGGYQNDKGGGGGVTVPDANGWYWEYR